ncbi:MAG: 30S ribosomal protein S17 [Candidatus Levybacteria bacterium RIFCSPHIGHO2_02_FULL_37_10]|nr:MAG: 30S ribosomal protein S17 [Candidatus Levybacteria bacterium RIFCSPHIGHO2_02_FULL_37_10]
MIKKIDGIIIAVKMQKTAIVRITRRFPHPLYKKLIKRDNRLSVDVATFLPVVGDRVKIVETKPISKTKHFKIVEVMKNDSA